MVQNITNYLKKDVNTVKCNIPTFPTRWIEIGRLQASLEDSLELTNEVKILLGN